MSVRSTALPLLILTASVAQLFAVEPQPQAHAHNDYEHKRPLLDALDHGFCSVEADVFAIDGELRVAHFRVATKPGRTLEKLYLDPLKERVTKNNGSVYKDPHPFMLLIDFKTDGKKIYMLLKQSLENYPELFTKKDGQEHPPVSIVISGARPVDLICNDEDRICGIDGRIGDLDTKLTRSEMPLISDNWRSHFKWKGSGDIPKEEHAKLIEIVSKAHDAGRRVRFWATPERKSVWKVLADAGVDHINTDKLADLETFLKNRPK